VCAVVAGVHMLYNSREYLALGAVTADVTHDSFSVVLNRVELEVVL